MAVPNHEGRVLCGQAPIGSSTARCFCVSRTCGARRAQSYRFPSLLIDAVVHEDGTVHIVESRTVSFTGAFSGFYQSINLAGGISIDNVTVGEPGTAYEYNPAHNIGPAGTYFAERREMRLYVDWSFAAEDETRTFVLSYALHNAVLIHNDTAEFYYKLVGDDWDRGVDQAVVTLRLPSGAAPEEIRAWGHGPSMGWSRLLMARRCGGL